MVFTLNIDNIITTTTTLSLENDTYLVDASGGGLTITLPLITADGMHYKITRIDKPSESPPSEEVILQGDGIPAETIDGFSSVLIVTDTTSAVVSFNGAWYRINRAAYNINSSVPLSFRFDVPSGGPLDTSSLSYITAGSFVYRGTAIDNIINQVIGIVGTTNTQATGQLRIYDVTNMATIVESSIFGPTNDAQLIIDLTNITNLPTGKAIFHVQLRKVSTQGGGSASIYTIQLYG